MVVSASAAIAADVPVALKAPAAPAFYNWTGIYVGGHVGYGQGMKDWTNSSFDYDVKGFLGGGQIGFNQQIGNWVIGVEADASWSNIKGDQTLTAGGPIIGSTQIGTASTTVDRIVTLAGRLGFAQDRWLVYVKGGAAWAHESHTFGANSTFAFPGAVPISQSENYSGNEDRFGYVVGIGSEFALWGNWSFKSEYNYANFGNPRVRLPGTVTNAGLTTPASRIFEIEQSLHLAKFGLNYRFGPDTPPSIAPSPPVPGYNWTGAWVGAQVGYGFGRKQWPNFAPSDPFDVNGWMGGVSTGASVQAGVFVVGVETEWLWTNIRGASQAVTAPGVGSTQTTDVASRADWLSLNSVRVGFVAADRWLVYVKGGVAFAHESHDLDAMRVSFGSNQSADFKGSALHTGYLAGIGVEHAFLGNWSAKLEYNYVNFRLQDVNTSGLQSFTILPATIGSIGNFQRVSIREEMHFVKFGVNYRFGAFPDVVTARY